MARISRGRLQSEQVGQLQAFVNAYLNVARQSVAALEEAQEALAETCVISCRVPTL